MSRFWAWHAYFPFSLAVTLVFCGHWAAEVVVYLILLGMVPLHLLLIAVEARHLSIASAKAKYFPESKLLQQSIGVGGSGALLQLIIEFRRDSSLTEKVGNFFFDMVMPWMVGSLASQIPLIAFISVLATITFTISVTPVTRYSSPIAKLSLLVLVILSLFTIWVTSSPLNTAEQYAGFALEVFIKHVIALPVDLAVTVAWLVGLVWAFSAINRERTRYRPPELAPIPFPPMWVKLAVPALAWASLLAAMLVNIVRQ